MTLRSGTTDVKETMSHQNQLLDSARPQQRVPIDAPVANDAFLSESA